MARIVVSDLSNIPCSDSISFTYGEDHVALDVTSDERADFEAMLAPYLAAWASVNGRAAEPAKPVKAPARSSTRSTRRPSARRKAAINKAKGRGNAGVSQADMRRRLQAAGYEVNPSGQIKKAMREVYARLVAEDAAKTADEAVLSEPAK